MALTACGFDGKWIIELKWYIALIFDVCSVKGWFVKFSQSLSLSEALRCVATVRWVWRIQGWKMQRSMNHYGLVALFLFP